jgi:glycosyltransferase involved in cell wall biosynthesis
MTLKISVVLPVYNCEKYVAASVQSILDQDLKDFELIIVDGGSSDATLSILRNFHDERIIIIEHKNKTPLVESLNEGIRVAKGLLIARQDSDDISHPKRLATQYATFCSDENLAALGTAYFCMDKEGKLVAKSFPKERITLADFKEGNQICHGSVMFRKDMVLNEGLYDPLFRSVEDYELWCRLSYKNYKIANLSEHLYYLRLHNQRISERNFKESILRHCLVEEVYFGGLEKTRIDASSSNDLKYLYTLLSSDYRKEYHRHMIANFMKSKKYTQELKEFMSLAKLYPNEAARLMRNIFLERTRQKN